MRYLKRQSIFILVGIFLVFGALVSGAVNAQTPVGGGNPLDDIEITIATEIIIPGSEVGLVGGFLRGKVGDLAGYLSIIYNFLISIVGVVAGVFILVGGFQYLTAGGDSARVTSARNRIANALIGMVLALSSFVLLNTINPALVNLELPSGLKKKVTTQLAYLPFCDTLLKEFNATLEQIVITSKRNDAGARGCGEAGYLEKGTTVGQDGVERTGRLWCIFRGELTGRPEDGFGGGCGLSGENTVERWKLWFGSDSHEISLPELCLIQPNIGPTDLDKEWDNGAGKTQGHGTCTACFLLNKENETVKNYFDGNVASSCQAWMNTANNGRADDYGYSYDHKKEVGFNLRNKNVWQKSEVYYCGQSLDQFSCVAIKSVCGGINVCSDYTQNEHLSEIYFCDDEGCKDEEIDNNPLEGAFPLHGGRVCRANPCGAKGACSAGAITDTLQQTGISSGGAIYATSNALRSAARLTPIGFLLIDEAKICE